MIWHGCTWPLPKCWRQKLDWLIWVTLSFLSNWKANSKSKKFCAKIQFILMTWGCDGKDKIWPSPTPIPQGGTPCNRLHWEAVPEKGIASFWKGDTLWGLKVCERGSTFHGWHMRGLSSPVKTTKSVSRGKRFDIVWEPPAMKLPWDCSWFVLGGWRVTGWMGKMPKRSVWFSEAGNK